MDIFKTFKVTRFEGKLENGIRVVLFHREGAPISTTAILNSGSKHDPEKNPGLAHFLEHMIVNGSSEFPSKDLLSEHIESVGGSYGASTGQEVLSINTEISEKSDYDRVVDIYNATLCKPLMNQKVFENEKSVILKEIQKSNSNPSQILTKTTRQLFLRGTPFEHEILGTENSISELEFETAMSEYKKLFDASRITFIVSGDITIQEITTSLNALTFLHGNHFVPENNEFKTSKETQILSTYLDVPQTQINFGVEAPKSFTKESLHLNILGSILAGGRASRLTKKLRYDKGLIYDIGFGRTGGVSCGAWRITTSTSDNEVQKVINEIIGEIKDIQKNGVKESELEFVKNRRIKSLKRTMQTSGDWVDFHASSEVFSNEYYDINTFVKDVQETTIEDINAVIKKYLNEGNWKLALCGRTKAESITIQW